MAGVDPIDRQCCCASSLAISWSIGSPAVVEPAESFAQPHFVTLRRVLAEKDQLARQISWVQVVPDLSDVEMTMSASGL